MKMTDLHGVEFNEDLIGYIHWGGAPLCYKWNACQDGFDNGFYNNFLLTLAIL